MAQNTSSPSTALQWMARDKFSWDSVVQVPNSRRRMVGPAQRIMSHRDAVIQAARITYRTLDGFNRRICSERAWIDDTLRERGLKLLANSEAKAAGVGEEPGEKPQAGNLARKAAIKAARNEYAAMPEKQRQMCSEVAWVNETLRERGMDRLGDDEVETLGISAQ